MSYTPFDLAEINKMLSLCLFILYGHIVFVIIHLPCCDHLAVINELDGLAQGKRHVQHSESADHVEKVRTRARATVDYLEAEFEKKHTHLKALTSKGSTMETISFRSEETDMTVS